MKNSICNEPLLADANSGRNPLAVQRTQEPCESIGSKKTRPHSAGEANQNSLRLITRFEFRESLGGISDDKLYGLIRDGVLPPPMKIGTASRWLASDADDYIQKLSGARQSPVPPAGIRRHHEKLASQRAARVVDAIERSRKAAAAQ
ncbi:MAG TPA: hypothetical protein VLC71_09695 [Thermomonas sp.]|nr:hypothetical protein [Thermomonas sp.]